MNRKKTNIIFIFSDQQRWDTVGCYGQRLKVTPNLDSMAVEGTKFEHAFSCQPVCGPARAALQTGRYPTELGCETNHRILPIHEPTIAKAMNKNGYETAYIGKWHLASAGPDDCEDNYRVKPIPEKLRGGYKDFWLASDTLEFTSHGYDGHMFDGDGNRWEFPEGRFRADAQTDWVLEYLENRKTDDPFFLFVSYIEPHHQNDRNCYEGPHGSKEKYSDYDVPGDLIDRDGDWQENYPDYLGCINSLDTNVGRIRKKVKELGIDDNTLIIYTSDHGSHFKTRNGEYKRSCHEASLRVPMIIAGPGFEGGKTVEELVSLIDLPPTIMEAAGIAPFETMRGESLQALAAEENVDWRDNIFAQISESHCGRCVRTSRWKYSVRAPYKNGRAPHAQIYVEDFLYDLDNDPHEQNNLVTDPSLDSVRAKLREKLLVWMKTVNEPTIEIRPALQD